MSLTSRLTIPAVSALTLALLGSGCGSGGSDGGQAVEGKVALDGKPIEKGQIVLAHVNGQTAATGEITNGEFRLRPSDGAVPGKYRVSIHAAKKTGRSIPHPDFFGEKIEEVVEAIPPVFNVNTKLEAEIKADGSNALEFALVTPPKAKSTARRR